MSKMSELELDIEYLLEQGMSFVEVARELEIPVHFVTEARSTKSIVGAEEEKSPFATINS